MQTPSSHWNCVRTLQTTTQLTTVETCCLALWYGPVYLSHCLCPAWLQSIKTVSTDEGRRQLRCAKSRTCVVRRTYSNYGDRCFAAAGPKLWNSLPTDLRQAGINFQRHKRLLTIFLFGWWDRAALLLTVKAAPHKFSFLFTYLLTHTSSYRSTRGSSPSMAGSRRPLRRSQEEMWVREATQRHQSTPSVMVRACDKNESRQASENIIALGSWREANERTSSYNTERHHVARCITPWFELGRNLGQSGWQERKDWMEMLDCSVCSAWGGLRSARVTRDKERVLPVDWTEIRLCR